MIGTILILGVLIPLNFALTGYEIVSVVQSDFDKVPDLWFWRFGNKPLPGTLCDPRVLNMGDNFFTNYTLLPWTIDTIFEKPPLDFSFNASRNPTIPTLSYSGHNLDNCDIVNMAVTGNLQPPAYTFKASVICNDTDLPIMMSTTYSEDSVNIPMEYFLGVLLPQIDLGVDLFLLSARTDLNNSLTAGLVNLNALLFTGVTDLGVIFCHNQRLGAINPLCTAVPAELPLTGLTLTWANGTITSTTLPPSSDVHPGLYTTAVSNTLQLLLAAVRLDIGNVLPNNFLIYPTILNASISMDTTLGKSLLTDNDMLPGAGNGSRPAVIASQYLCHFPQRKSIGSAIISVLVATLSMFGSAWAAFLIVATIYEKRKHPQDNAGNYRLPQYEMLKKDDTQEVAQGHSSQE
ncbi:hypothetical protein FRB94_008689 [Tulasnella sp. JGI-2019a]|nr:hypothetical protein FRB94_008689 [Tulasnella sp. JGI-2019a]